MGEVTLVDLSAAEREACRLECLLEEAENTARRLRNEYAAQVWYVRELVRAMGERAKQVGGERDLFTEATG